MYKLIYHKNMTCKKWNQFSKGKQILLIANDINRVKNLLKTDHFDKINQCYERAFELIDLSVNDPKWSKYLKEILRMREVLSHLYILTDKDGVLNDNLLKALISLTQESYNSLK